jgi:hypothetical protein
VICAVTPVPILATTTATTATMAKHKDTVGEDIFDFFRTDTIFLAFFLGDTLSGFVVTVKIQSSYSLNDRFEDVYGRHYAC